MRSQSYRKRGRDASESATTRATRFKTSHSTASGHQYSPTGRQSPTAIMANSYPANGPSTLGKGTVINSSNTRLVSDANLAASEQAANGFPVTVFPPATPASGDSTSLCLVRKNPAKGNTNAHSKGSKSSQATARSINNNRLEHHLHHKQRTGLTADMLVVSALRRQQMKDAFQPWVMQTYGDAAKTKTISQRKAERIVKILRGEDRSNGADSSKFRFWVRAKGFRLGPPQIADKYPTKDRQSIQENTLEELYVVTSTAKDEHGEDRPLYKKVAVVEEFFDIIYREHVEFGGRATGKHAGQKRTYRAITEIYAFLPREAVTRFLMQCAECQRRGSSIASSVAVSAETASLLYAPSPQSTLSPLTVSPGSPTPPASPTWKSTTPHPVVPLCGGLARDAWPALTATLPPSQSQLVAPNGAGTFTWTPGTSGSSPLALALNDIDLSLPLTTTLLKHARLSGVSPDRLFGLDRAESSFASESAAYQSNPNVVQGMTAAFKPDEETFNLNPTSASANSSLPVIAGQTFNSSVSMATTTSLPGLGPPNAALLTNEQTSPITLDLSSKQETVEDNSPGAVKDEDDEDDDDGEDKIDNQVYDPERLKAFNMFVRLFVDENLDRMVPISRQPREKVQAIIDSCLRQFPEFGERARKRIRTYLKSCRRNKRSRDSSGIDAQNRPMPPHLTSAAAEQILAQACENENQNAKRLRMGLEPISQPLPMNVDRSVNEASVLSHSPPHPGTASGTEPTTVTTGSGNTNLVNLFRPAFGPYHRSNTVTSIGTSNGPTDLSTKSRSTTAPSNGAVNSTGVNRTSPLPHKLNTAEILAVRQLVTGYRESAAFLLRSADELEQLLLQQHTSL